MLFDLIHEHLNKKKTELGTKCLQFGVGKKQYLGFIIIFYHIYGLLVFL